MEISFEAVDEERPGEKWRRLFDRHWHAYSRWFLREGVRQRPTYLDCRRAVRQHMPELRPVYEELCKAAARGESVIADQRPLGPHPRRVLRDKAALAA